MSGLSIVIPTYNCGEYIETCINSLARLEYDELIIVDDGSTDQTEEIIDSLSNKKLVYIKTDGNFGVSAARNIGLERVRSKYVMFMDADDSLVLHQSRLIKGVVNKDFDLVVFGNEIQNEEFFGDEIPKDEIYLSLAGYKQYPGFITAVFSKLYRVDMLRMGHITFNESVKKAEDAIFNLEVVQSIDSVKFVQAGLYKYRNNTNSITKSVSYNVSKNYIVTSTWFAEFFSNQLSSEQHNSLQLNWMLREIYCLTLSNQNPADSLREIMSHYRKIVVSRYMVNWRNIRNKHRVIYVCLLMRLYPAAVFFEKYKREKELNSGSYAVEAFEVL